MNPAVRKMRLKPTNTGEMRIAYSPKEVLTKMQELGGPRMTLAQLKEWEDMRVIPPSLFVFEAHFYTLRQIHLLTEWWTGQFPSNVHPGTYLLDHWQDPDEEETEKDKE